LWLAHSLLFSVSDQSRHTSLVWIDYHSTCVLLHCIGCCSCLDFFCILLSLQRKALSKLCDQHRGCFVSINGGDKDVPRKDFTLRPFASNKTIAASPAACSDDELENPTSIKGKELLRKRDLKLLPALALLYLLLFLGCSIFWLLLCFVCFFVFIDRGRDLLGTVL